MSDKEEKEEEPDFDRDRLVKKVRDLENKETWIRKNLKEFLEMWAEVTEDLPKDETIKHHKVAETHPRNDYGHSYGLKAGKNYIVRKKNPEGVNKYSKKKLKWLDISEVHKIVDNLPEELERFYNRLDKRDEEYEEAQEKLENLLRYKP